MRRGLMSALFVVLVGSSSGHCLLVRLCALVPALHRSGRRVGHLVWVLVGFGGTIPDFLILGSIITVYRHHNCHVKGCCGLGRRRGTPYWLARRTTLHTRATSDRCQRTSSSWPTRPISTVRPRESASLMTLDASTAYELRQAHWDRVCGRER